MWDLLKSFLAFGLATSLEKLIAFLLLPLYTKVFSVVEYGYIDLIQVTFIIITAFSVLQFETSLQRYYYEYRGKIKVLFISTVFNSILLFSICISILVIIFYPVLEHLLFKQQNLEQSFLLASIQIPFSNIIMLLLLITRFERKSLIFSIAILLKILLTLICTYLFIVFYSYGIEGVFAAQLISNILIAGFLLVKNVRYIKLAFSKRLFLKAFYYAYPQIPARLGSVLSGNINRYLMIGYLSVASVGIYSLALKVASVMQLAYTAFILAWNPFMFQQLRKTDNQQNFANSLSLISCPVFFLVTLMALFSPEILQIVTSSEEYKEASFLIGGLSFYFSIFIFKEIVDIGPRFKERTIYISINYFFSLLVNIGLLLLLIKKLEEKGVVLSMIATNIVLLVASWYFSNRLYPVAFRVRYFIGLLLPALLVVLFMMYYECDLYFRLFFMIICSLFYGVMFFNSLKKLKMYSLI